MKQQNYPDLNFVIEGPLLDQAARCEPILRALPDWFGIETSSLEGLLFKLVDDNFFIGEFCHQFQLSAHCSNDPLQCTDMHIRLSLHLGNSRLV